MQALSLAQVKGLSDLLWLSSRDHKQDTIDPKQYGPAFRYQLRQIYHEHFLK